MKLTFSRVKCTRCGGTGRYPSSAWDGVCLKCNGTGNMLTKEGLRAKTKYEEWAGRVLTFPVSELKPGMVVADSIGDGKYRTALEIREDKHNAYEGVNGTILVFKGISLGGPADRTVRRRPTADELRALAVEIGEGCTIVE